MHGRWYQSLGVSFAKSLGFCLVIFLNTPLTKAQAGSVRGQVDFQGETVHLEFDGQSSWNYDLKRKFDAKNHLYFELTVPALTAQSIRDYQKVKNILVSKIEVDAQSPTDKTVLRIFPASEKVDFFDYLTDQPSRLVVDLYVNEDAVKEKTNRKNTADSSDAETTATPRKKTAKKKVADAKGNKDARKPATADYLAVNEFGSLSAAPRAGLFDGSDPFYERFNIKDYEVKEEAIIRSRNNYYIPFPMMNVVTNNWNQVKQHQDNYQIEPKEGKENKDARLLSRIFDRKDSLLFLKTLGWFEKSYPESQYLEALSYMKADTMMELWRKDTYRKSIGDNEKPEPTPDKWFTQAIDSYRDALRKYPQSPLAERTSLKVGILLYDKKDYFDAIRAFNEHINNKNFGDPLISLSKNMARLGQAQAFMNIGKSADALAIYNELEQQSKLENIKAEAAFRRGDVFYKDNKYVEAIAEYQKALKTYSKFEQDFPEAIYHQGESQFWLANYRGSLNAYREFIRKFPSHEDSAFATTRVGELLDILGADSTRVMGAYLETIFRFGESPKTSIARIRMTNQRMKSLKPKEVEIAVNQIMDLSKKLDLPKIDQFATIMISDGFSKRGEYPTATNLLIKYYQEHPNTVEKELFQRKIVSNINESFQEQVDAGQFIAALKTHQKYADNWLKSSPRLDTQFNVGRAFEQAGVPQEAEKYYKNVLNSLYSLSGTAKARETSVLEKLPSDQELLLRLAEVNFHTRNYSQSLDYIRQIKTPQNMPEDQQIERIDIISQLFEKKGDEDTAIVHLKELIETWKGKPEKVASPYLRLAEAELKLGKETESLRSLQRIEEIQSDSKSVDPDIHAAALKMTADIYLKNGQNDKAIAAIENMLKAYGKTTPYASYRYRLGDLYFKKGDVQKAKTAWNELDGVKDKFWAGLAQEQMSSQKWNDEYKRYLQRIPATAKKVE